MNALFSFKSPEDPSALIFPKTINVHIAGFSEPAQLLFEGRTRSVEIEETPPILQKREYLLVNVLHHLGIAHVVNRYGGNNGNLIQDLGGEETISTQQEALIDLCIKSKLMLDSIDAWLLTRRTKEVPSLTEYLNTKYGSPDTSPGSPGSPTRKRKSEGDSEKKQHKDP